MTDLPNDDLTEKEPLGPRDQDGFDHLKPHPDHPMAFKEREEQRERERKQKLLEESQGDEDPPEEKLGLLDHLDELRTTLIHSSLAAAIASVLSWFVSGRLLDLLILPIREYGVYFTAPNEAFMTRLKMSGAMGLFIVAPFIFFKFYMFILPGLHKREAKMVTPLLMATVVLFYTGVAFSYLIVIPQIIPFFMSFGTEILSPLISVGEYFSLVSRLCLAFGLVFQLPLLVLFVCGMGIVDPRLLLRTWRMAMVMIFIMSAVLTPADIPSQLMMAGPLLILYFGSVLVAFLITRGKRKED